ncbi:MAG: Holliday junction branch migration protein RuvA [Lachnospiraceae bacterium]|nr:Holliday junction branch migration protein RuvA [Lachnospiraceae bacterium]
MYSYIKGTLEEIGEDYIVVDNHGIGYRIYVPGSVLDVISPVGGEVKVHTHLNVKEDAFNLYGFMTKDDMKVFQLLLGVGGIGPKGALAILSVMTTDDLRFAVMGGDAKAIAKAPGVGAKTAQRVILELKDKLKIEDVFEEKDMPPSQGNAQGKTVKNEAVQALVALGYSSTEALSVLSKIEITEDLDVEDVLKAALKQMAIL